MRHLLILVAMMIETTAYAQSNWTSAKSPATTSTSSKITKAQLEKEEREAEAIREQHYLEKDIIPVTAEGEVVFTFEKDFPGATAKQIYDAVFTFLNEISNEDVQLEEKKDQMGVTMVNEQEHQLVARYDEWLTFTKKLLMLDRAEMSYFIIANCTEGHLQMTIEHITYSYETHSPGGFRLPAEKVITNKYAINKKGTKLMPTYGKFRRRTIDRVEDIFSKASALNPQTK